ncbi:MAG: Gfo/Idh/MocA family oxidoreductase [Candidatus Latescibacteria bacterium]|nr:Gfo/Idh/MocA family oxidoreductase [Candidatus Latescibacterota bacterium]
MAENKYRAGAIGHTGRGNFGHRLHMPYNQIGHIDFVALADPDEGGRSKALSDTQASSGYADYREMLDKESLDIVSVCPRWVDQHEEMLLACVEAGCHIYCEKPMTSDLASADRIVSSANAAGVKIAVAHQGVYLPQMHALHAIIASGQIGQLLAMEACGKQDHRGGGEDTLVLGTHLFNMMRFFAGDPLSVFGRVCQEGRDVQMGDAREANEPIGLIAGDFITSTHYFHSDVVGHFVSRKNQLSKGRGYGLVLIGESGRLAINGDASWVAELNSDVWSPWAGGLAWQALDIPKSSLQEDGNRLAILSLVDAIENDTEPISSAGDARWALEMIHGIYASHLAHARVSLPLAERGHPLAIERR